MPNIHIENEQGIYNHNAPKSSTMPLKASTIH